MKRIYSLLCFCFLLTVYSNNAGAQYYFYNDSYYDSPILFEVGGSVGAMNSFTDLGGKKGVGGKFKDLNMGNTEFSGGVFVNAIYKNAVALRLEASFGKVSGFDSILASVDKADIASARYNRNLNFRSNITEYSLIAEIHPLFIFINWESRDSDPPKYSPYLLGGIGYYSFNPQGQLGNRWIDLQPLSTEGQGFAEYPDRPVYKLKQTNIPLGAGIKYEISPIINIRGEFVYRVLNTDYLDDLSTTYIDPAVYLNYFTGAKLANAIAMSDRQKNKITFAGGKRGSPKQNDSFFSFNLKLSLTLGREKIR